VADGEVPGIEDLPRLGRWLHDNGVLASATPPEVRLIAGGRSNLTYLVDPRAAAGPDAPLMVLRRPPLGHVLPTAHDMAREYRVLSALGGTGIPVPKVIALCPDPAVIGAPFYLMQHAPGEVLRTQEDGKRVSVAQARQLSELFADMLAAIHGVDPEASGLTGFGRPEGYLERQLARWQRQWELSSTREMPGFQRLTERLAAGLPGLAAAASAGTLVHGDYRVDNMLVTLGAQPAITAVLDWEMSTLGDPLADLGLSLVYWAERGDADAPDLSVATMVTAGPGFLTRAEIADRYAAATGRDVSQLGYYMAFGCFKLAVVLEGIHARFLQHKTVGEGFEREGAGVPLLIKRAHRLLDSAG
jgi:aminoglycoside phosphotransferase (APT) family kinase protein